MEELCFNVSAIAGESQKQKKEEGRKRNIFVFVCVAILGKAVLFSKYIGQKWPLVSGGSGVGGECKGECKGEGGESAGFFGSRRSLFCCILMEKKGALVEGSYADLPNKAQPVEQQEEKQQEEEEQSYGDIPVRAKEDKKQDGRFSFSFFFCSYFPPSDRSFVSFLWCFLLGGVSPENLKDISLAEFESTAPPTSSRVTHCASFFFFSDFFFFRRG